MKKEPKVLQKTVMVMKLTMFCLVVFSLAATAKVRSQAITLNVKNASLESVLTEVRKQTGYYYSIPDRFLREAKTITITVKKVSLQKVLELCFENQPFTYTIVSKTIVVQEKPKPQIVSSDRSSEVVKIEGVVVNESSLPLAGASVTNLQLHKSVITDAQGRFEFFAAPLNSALQISFVGYVSKFVSVKGTDPIQVTMEVATNILDQAVVQAYGSTTQRLTTGNITKITSKEIGGQPVSNALAAIEGRVPGLFITQSSGITGASFNVQLRGQNSISNGNDPLFIIDGVPFVNNTELATINRGAGVALSPLNSINPEDIESIEVLKDASATAIYGSRGANGVILITTKKGHPGKTNITASVTFGSGKSANSISLLNLQQYLNMRHQAFSNDGLTTSSPQYKTAYDINGSWDTTRSTNWQKVFLGGTANYTDVQGTATGGNANNMFLFATTYHKETTIMPGNFNDQRGAVHFNFNHSSTNQKFKLNLNTFFTEDQNILPVNNLASFIMLPPDAPALYDSAGKLNWQNSTWTNPFNNLIIKVKTVNDNLNANLNLSYEVMPGLSVSSSFGYNNLTLNSLQTTPKSSFNPAQTTAVASAIYSNSSIKSWIIEPQVHYKTKLRKGQLDAVIGSTITNQTQNYLVQTGKDYTSDALLENIQAAATLTVNTYNYSLYRYLAAFGRLEFNWDDKYLFSATLRRDGSSRFGPGQQMGNFGAIGAGWVFTKDINKKAGSFLSYGKIRGSYGTTGNDQIGNYNFLNTYSVFYQTYQGITPLYPTRLANADYAWEVNKKMEFGLDFGFFHDRVLLNVSMYRNRSSDQIIKYPEPSITGFTTVTANLPATVQNTGIEFSLNTVNIRTRNFKWTTTANLSIPKNKLIAFPNLSASPYYSGNLVVGQPLSILKTYQGIGVDPATGLFSFTDYDKDGKISSPNDRQFIIDMTPKMYGGISNNFVYKNWTLDFFLQFMDFPTSNFYGNIKMPGSMSNQPVEVVGAWEKAGDHAAIQRYSNSGSAAATAFSNFLNSNLIYKPYYYIRLKSLSLQYAFKGSWLRKAKLDQVRVFFQGQNLITVTNYFGIDPETRSLVPLIRLFAAGIQVSL